MTNVTEVCCGKCTHTIDTPCADFIKCKTEGPLCHESAECSAKIKSIVDNALHVEDSKVIIYLGAGTCGLASGMTAIIPALKSWANEKSLDVEFKEVGCFGLCHREPMLDIKRPGAPRISFGDVDTAEKAIDIVENYVVNNNILKEYALGYIKSDDADSSAREYTEIPNLYDMPILSRQRRIVLRNSGLIDPESLDEYITRGGYQALDKALRAKDNGQMVLDEVTASGLRGRGGGGFPTGRKWSMARVQDSYPKYIACNADEGDPGAFMDRSVLEGDPHRVIEGMMLGALAMGASFGYIYCRAEYPLAIARLEKSIEDLRAIGLLGKNILGSGFDFDLKVKKGAGAFVCGEETALIASIEGKRGMPTLRPPYPAVKGLFGQPTCLNNVETFANISTIVMEGGAWFASVGTEKSKGTKVFALTGKIKKGGLVEVPMGMTLRQVIFDVGGGIINDKPFKAVQIGGPSGGCLPEALLDTEIDYDNLIVAGAMMGSGGMVVMDEDTCMVDLARFFMGFIRDESCGKCAPCREGTTRLLEILERISTRYVPSTDEEKALFDDSIKTLEELGGVIRETSLCGLGQTAPNPVLATLRYFRDEYVAHIEKRKCPAKSCQDLLTYSINQEKCIGCTLCARKCPVSCIDGTVKEPHSIRQEDCIRCGNCLTVCKFGAVVVE